MRYSQMFSPTLRETPAEAEIVSHQLLLRAGFIRKSSAGIYSYLPLGLRVLHKIERMVREEMDRAGSQELMMPILQPAELWLESGRWHVYGGELMRMKDRHERDFCLGPTHEELITSLLRDEISSWRQLPQRLYQIQNKYRDERRPRFGLMRGREFIMKDLYSFDRDEEGLEESYQAMFEAYTRFFTRCGLYFRPVEADNGAIGGSSSHEFMVLAEAGEAEVIYCTSCDYAADGEIAEAHAWEKESFPTEHKAASRIETPGVGTMEALADFLGLPLERLTKTLLYLADEKPVCVLLRGDHDLNDIKLKNLMGCQVLRMALEEEVRQWIGAGFGSLGPVNLPQKIELIVDPGVAALAHTIVGANEDGYHYIDAVPGRDFELKRVADVRQVKAKDRCLRCGGILESARGIEAGQVFKLGTNYSEKLNLKFNDEKGESHPVVMGCYGIGVSRTMAAAVEQHHDENGIIWPMTLAPYHVVVVPTSIEGPLFDAALDCYGRLQKKGIEVVLDDRDERAGVKFKDADLIGYPVRITIGKAWTKEGMVELKWRKDQEVRVLPLPEAVAMVAEAVEKADPYAIS